MRWTAREGGAERANYQMFLAELCDVVGVARPEPAGAERELNDYVFERAVRRRDSSQFVASRHIDLYKKGCFVLEAKQSRLPGASKALPGQLSILPEEPERLGRPNAARYWDVMEAGDRSGMLKETIAEAGLDTDEPEIVFRTKRGKINANLTMGANVAQAAPLAANRGLSWNGMMLAGRGFVVSETEATHLSNLDGGAAAAFIKPFLNGVDLLRPGRKRYVIDLFGIDPAQARAQIPATYSHLLASVKPERDKARDAAFREKWWLFGRTRPELRQALRQCSRFIGTTETAKHRLFQFIDPAVVPDHMIIAIAIDDAWALAVLSSRIHVAWAMEAGGWLGVGNDPRYSKSRCFDAFPFPDPDEGLRRQLRSAGEELDSLRGRIRAENPDMTLTSVYNVVEKLRTGATLTDRDEDVKRRGLALILLELHQTIDRLTAQAYGWPSDIAAEEVLERLVALNAARVKEEATSHVRWLRPQYQKPRYARDVFGRSGDLALEPNIVAIDRRLPAFPADSDEQVLAVEAMLAQSGRAMGAAEIARCFRRGDRRIEPRVEQLLASLARYGHATALADGRFVTRQAA